VVVENFMREKRGRNIEGRTNPEFNLEIKMRCFASSCWLIVLVRAVAYNFHLTGINPENGEKSIFDLYSATLPLLVDKPTGSAITSVIVDDIDAGAGASIQTTPQLVGGLRTQSRLNLSVPFHEPSTVSELSALLSRSSSNTDIDVILPPDPKLWSRALSPSFSSLKSTLLLDHPIRRQPDPSGSYPYVLASGPPPPSEGGYAEPPPPTLLFIHGSFHSPDCYADNFMPFFSSHSIPCTAIPLRGIRSGYPSVTSTTKVTIDEHVSDLSKFLSSSPSTKFILVSHSFGGILAMKTLLQESPPPNVVSACFMCSVPPSGNGPMTKRFLKRDLGLSYKITKGLAFKRVTKVSKGEPVVKPPPHAQKNVNF
jgi:hypothetical protein